MTHDDASPPGAPRDGTPLEGNVERLLARSYRPEGPSPEFARRVEERMLAEAATARRARPRTRLWLGLGTAAAAAVIVAVSLSGGREPEPVTPPGPALTATEARRATAMQKHEAATLSPMLRELKWLPAKFDDPFVLSQQYEPFEDESERHKNAERERKAQWVADTDAVIFHRTYERWLEHFGTRFRMPRLETTDRVLHAVITWDRDAFAGLFKRHDPGVEVGAGAGLHGGIRAYYSPHQRRIYHYLGDEAMRSQDEFPCAGGRVQKFAYQVAAHEETHQLLHEYAAIFRGRPLSDRDEDVPSRRAMWFDEGLAEFMGAIEVDRAAKDDLARADFSYERLPLGRIAAVRGSVKGTERRDQAKLWTIEKLLRPAHHGELEALAKELDPAHASELVSLFYARAWGLVHFLWFYDGGKYRDRVYATMETVLRDELSAAGFAQIMGRSGPADWGDVALEYEWYWNECLKRIVGSADDPRTAAETGPPQGRWTPDEPK